MPDTVQPATLTPAPSIPSTLREAYERLKRVVDDNIGYPESVQAGHNFQIVAYETVGKMLTEAGGATLVKPVVISTMQVDALMLHTLKHFLSAADTRCIAYRRLVEEKSRLRPCNVDDLERKVSSAGGLYEAARQELVILIERMSAMKSAHDMTSEEV